MEPEVHEFWLGGIEANRHIYRVALGELIDERDRKALNPRLVERCSNKSGSIGFMDVAVRHHYVPKHGAEDGNYFNYEHVEALTILGIGIEPEHEGRAMQGCSKKGRRRLPLSGGRMS